MKEELARSEDELEQVRAERDLLRAETAALQTEIARRIAAQQDADRRWRDLFERTGVGLAAIDLNGRIRDANAAFAALVGEAGVEALLGRRITAFTHPDDRADDADVLTTLSLAARERAWIVKRRLDGQRQLLLYHLGHDAEGEPSTIVVRDASDLLDAVGGAQPVARGPLASLGAGLEGDDAWRLALAGVMKHELRTPVGLMTGFAAILAQELGPEPSPAGRRALEGLADGAARLTRLTDDLDAFVGWSAAAADADRPIHAPGALAAAALALGAAGAAKAGVGLAIEGPDDLPAVACDDGAIALALRHLIDNAVAASPAGGAVVLRLAADGDDVILAVEDAGPGVPPEARERALSAFRQLRMDPAREKGGLGLGLALAQAIAAAHGGSLSLGDAPAGGTAARLRLPRA